MPDSVSITEPFSPHGSWADRVRALPSGSWRGLLRTAESFVGLGIVESAPELVGNVDDPVRAIPVEWPQRDPNALRRPLDLEARLIVLASPIKPLDITVRLANHRRERIQQPPEKLLDRQLRYVVDALPFKEQVVQVAGRAPVGLVLPPEDKLVAHAIRIEERRLARIAPRRRRARCLALPISRGSSRLQPCAVWQDAQVAERVVAFPIGVRWSPNAPDAILVCADRRACLAVEPHDDDQDERMVVLVWDRCMAAKMSPPNDEARHRHRLYDKGLGDVLWVGEVIASEWHAALAPMVYDAASIRHFVVVLKEGCVEALAVDLRVERRTGTPAEAALAALASA